MAIKQITGEGIREAKSDEIGSTVAFPMGNIATRASSVGDGRHLRQRPWVVAPPSWRRLKPRSRLEAGATTAKLARASSVGDGRHLRQRPWAVAPPSWRRLKPRSRLQAGATTAKLASARLSGFFVLFRHEILPRGDSIRRYWGIVDSLQGNG